ncbi:MAG: hypothetical protein AAF356_13135 [Planctomycetota bacterium]
MIAAVAVAACAGMASAQISVVLSGTQSITEAGQMFTFDFGAGDGVLEAISAGSLTVTALGDYSVVPPSSETMDWDIDGVASGQGFDAGAFSGPIDLFQNSVSQSFDISMADMIAITSDGSVTITIQNGSTVDFFVDQPEDFVSVSLEYRAVPTPGVAGLLGLGGLIAARRRRA